MKFDHRGEENLCVLDFGRWLFSRSKGLWPALHCDDGVVVFTKLFNHQFTAFARNPHGRGLAGEFWVCGVAGPSLPVTWIIRELAATHLAVSPIYELIGFLLSEVHRHLDDFRIIHACQGAQAHLDQLRCRRGGGLVCFHWCRHILALQ